MVTISGIFLEYAWVFVVLIGLEGILAADNAVVMAMMVKHLPKEQHKRALLYGLGGAVIFRFASLFLISFLVDIWQIQALGAAYLIYIALRNLWKNKKKKSRDTEGPGKKQNNSSGFWMSVLKVELADIAFAIDSILAAVALAATLPNTDFSSIGGMDGAKFIVIFVAGMIGVVLIRFAATYFIRLLENKPGLENAAYVIIGWVGIKLGVHVLAHPNLKIIPEHFPESIWWKVTFWGILVAIALVGWFSSSDKRKANKKES
nr:TerC family protein [Halobacillus massiliensis]